jgi:hypothetical protein
MGYELTETLWETEAKDRVVKDGDPEARFLVGVAGQTLSDEEAKRLGLGQRKAESQSESKAVQPEDVANKSITMGGGDAKGKGR